MRYSLAFFCMAIMAGAAAGIARADIVVLTDGTTRTGIIESRSSQELILRIDRDGIKGSLTIPLSQVARIDPSPPDPTPTATTQQRLPPLFANHVLDPRGLVVEMLSEIIANGPGDPRRLPPNQRALWETAVQLDARGLRADALHALRDLEDSLRDIPGGPARLDAVTRQTRDQSFGQWLAQVHWDVMADKYKTGPFDVSDVRDAERPVLIGILREKTPPALEPLRTYFPPLDPKTGNPQPFRPAMVAGITRDNALEVKDKALFAVAVLVAQLKLEPDMPAIDRQLLSSQLANVNHVLSRARDLEPAARQALARADLDRRAADEKTRRANAIIQQHAALGPK